MSELSLLSLNHKFSQFSMIFSPAVASTTVTSPFVSSPAETCCTAHPRMHSSARRAIECIDTREKCCCCCYWASMSVVAVFVLLVFLYFIFCNFRSSDFVLLLTLSVLTISYSCRLSSVWRMGYILILWSSVFLIFFFVIITNFFHYARDILASPSYFF